MSQDNTNPGARPKDVQITCTADTLTQGCADYTCHRPLLLRRLYLAQDCIGEAQLRSNIFSQPSLGDGLACSKLMLEYIYNVL